MYPEGYFVDKDYARGRWLLQASESVYNMNNRKEGKRRVASGPIAGVSNELIQRIAWLDHEAQTSYETRATSRRELAKILQQNDLSAFTNAYRRLKSGRRTVAA